MLEMKSTLFCVSGLEVIDKGLRGLPWSQEEKRAWFEWIKPLHEIMKPRLPQLRYACNHCYCCGLYLIIHLTCQLSHLLFSFRIMLMGHKSTKW